MRVFRRSSLIGVAILVTIAVGLALAAQPAQPPPKDAPLVFGADVALVALPVFVTDKNGKAVPGLTVEDFEIEEDGRKTPIVAFQAIDVDAPATVASLAETGSLPAAIRAAAPRQFMVLIDQQFSAGGPRGPRAATSFLRKTLAPGDLASVAISRQNGLRILTNFTTNHEDVARAIEGKGFMGAAGSDPLGLGGGFQSAPVGSSADREFEELDELVKRAEEKPLIHKITAFLADLSTLVKTLSPLRGRKQIILLSAGFPEGVLSQVEGGHLLARMEALYRQAAEADVVIQAVSLAGIAPAIDLGSRTGRGGVVSDGPPTKEGLQQLAEQDRLDPGRGTLAILAHGTGGRLIMPRNDIGKALSEVDQISRQSYVIAFEAAEGADASARPRRLKVRVRGSGLSVSHRASYSLHRARDAAAIKGLAAEAISKGLSEGPLRVHLTTLPHRDRNGKQALHASLHFEGPELAAAVQDAPLGVRVYGYLMEEGRIVDSLTFGTTVDPAKHGDALRASGIHMITAFPANAGAQDVRFFVQVGESELSGSVQQRVASSGFAEGVTVLSAPLFPLPLAGSVVIPFQPKGRPRLDVPFRFGNHSFVPEAPVLLTPGEARLVCVFVWPGRSAAGDPFMVTGDLVRSGDAATAASIEGTPRVIKDPDGSDRYLLSLRTPILSPGDATLRLTFRDPSTGLAIRTETEVRIKG